MSIDLYEKRASRFDTPHFLTIIYFHFLIHNILVKSKYRQQTKLRIEKSREGTVQKRLNMTMGVTIFE